MNNQSRSITRLLQQLIRWELVLLSAIAVGAMVWSNSPWQAKASNARDSAVKLTLLKTFTGRPAESLLNRTAILEGATVGTQRLVFAADDAKTGREPWITDGTSQGTKLLRDLVPGRFGSFPQGSDPLFLGSTGPRIFFKTKPLQPGPVSFWSSDGTTAGTGSLADLSAPFKTALGTVTWDRFQAEGIVKNRLVMAIAAADGAQVWASDGSQMERLLRLNTLRPGNSIEPNLFTTAGPYSFFVAGTNNATSQLWRTDGTSKGTIALKTLNPAAQLFTPWQNRVYLEAEAPQQGFELWASDGTPNGTVLLKDIYPGSEGSGPRLMTGLGKTMFALANSPQGFELWASDGTPATTRRIKRLNNQRSSRAERQFVVHQGKLFFSFIQPATVVGGGQTIDRWELWVTDGSEAGTRQIGAWKNGPIGDLTSLNNRLFFNANGPDGQELWVSDGTSQGTRQVVDLFPGKQWIAAPCLPPQPGFPPPNCPPPTEVPNSSNPRSLTAYKNRLYFIGDRPTNPTANPGFSSETVLWVSDGTASGTTPVQTSTRGTIYPSKIIPFNGQLLVDSFDKQREQMQLWSLR